MKHKVSCHLPAILDVQCENDEWLFKHVAPKTRHARSLQKYVISVAFGTIGLNFHHKIHQPIDGYMIIATWHVAVTLLVGCNADYELERPVGTTATNVASRANNRTIATLTMRAFPSC